MSTPYISTSCLSNKHDSFHTLEIYNNLGIKNVELGTCKEPHIDLGILKKYAFNYIVHHYFPPPEKPFIVNLASQNREILEKSIIQIRKSIDFCADFNINFFSFHAGFRVDPDINLKFSCDNIPEYENSFNIFRESVRKIVDYAEIKGVRIAIENNVLSEYNLIDGRNNLLLMCESWEYKRLFNEINSKNLGILLDIGHLKITSNLLKFNANVFIDELKDKTFAVHVHENNGRLDEHRCPKDGDWALTTVNRYFKNRNIPIVLECKCSNKEELRKTIMLLKKQ